MTGNALVTRVGMCVRWALAVLGRIGRGDQHIGVSVDHTFVLALLA